jgi:hypothetical protein
MPDAFVVFFNRPHLQLFVLLSQFSSRFNDLSNRWVNLRPHIPADDVLARGCGVMIDLARQYFALEDDVDASLVGRVSRRWPF